MVIWDLWNFNFLLKQPSAKPSKPDVNLNWKIGIDISSTVSCLHSVSSQCKSGFFIRIWDWPTNRQLSNEILRKLCFLWLFVVSYLVASRFAIFVVYFTSWKFPERWSEIIDTTGEIWVVHALFSISILQLSQVDLEGNVTLCHSFSTGLSYWTAIIDRACPFLYEVGVAVSSLYCRNCFLFYMRLARRMLSLSKTKMSICKYICLDRFCDNQISISYHPATNSANNTILHIKLRHSKTV